MKGVDSTNPIRSALSKYVFSATAIANALIILLCVVSIFVVISSGEGEAMVFSLYRTVTDVIIFLIFVVGIARLVMKHIMGFSIVQWFRDNDVTPNVKMICGCGLLAILIISLAISL